MILFSFLSNDSQLSTQSQTSLSLPPPQVNNNQNNTTGGGGGMVPNLTNPAITHEQIVANVVPNGTVPQASTVGSMTPGGHEGMFSVFVSFVVENILQVFSPKAPGSILGRSTG